MTKATRGVLVVAVVAALLLLPSASLAQTHRSVVTGFGGMTFGNSTTATSFGGAVDVGLTDNVHAIGEVGRLMDVLPSSVDRFVDFAPVDVRISAFYAEGGVRLIGSAGRALRPYVDATAGMARLQPRYSGPGDDFVNVGLQFLDSTEPLLGLGGGVMVHGGPLVFDIGYRFRKIFADSGLASVLDRTDGLTTSQARVGIGVSF
jgi:hypothetical protein